MKKILNYARIFYNILTSKKLKNSVNINCADNKNNNNNNNKVIQIIKTIKTKIKKDTVLAI